MWQLPSNSLLPASWALNLLYVPTWQHPPLTAPTRGGRAAFPHHVKGLFIEFVATDPFYYPPAAIQHTHTHTLTLTHFSANNPHVFSKPLPSAGGAMMGLDPSWQFLSTLMSRCGHVTWFWPVRCKGTFPPGASRKSVVSQQKGCSLGCQHPSPFSFPLPLASVLEVLSGDATASATTSGQGNGLQGQSQKSNMGPWAPAAAHDQPTRTSW